MAQRCCEISGKASELRPSRKDSDSRIGAKASDVLAPEKRSGRYQRCCSKERSGRNQRCCSKKYPAGLKDAGHKEGPKKDQDAIRVAPKEGPKKDQAVIRQVASKKGSKKDQVGREEDAPKEGPKKKQADNKDVAPVKVQEVAPKKDQAGMKKAQLWKNKLTLMVQNF